VNPVDISLPIPISWEEYPAKRLFSDKCVKDHPDETPLASSQLFGVIPQELFEKTLDKQVMVATKGFENFKLVEKDDFVISLRSFQGGIEYSKYRGIISPAYTVLSKSSKVFSGFFIYYLKSDEFLQRINAVITGIREGKTIKYENFALLRLPLPPLETQKQIAGFLDKETSRIDALISRKQRQIELLQEKRQAIITQSVTKGLNPDVKMKDSGVEWIGEIPEHWGVDKIRHLTLVKRGASPRPIDDPKYFDEEGKYSWVRIADVTASSKYLETTTQRLSKLGSSLSVKLVPGKLFLSIAGSVGKPILTKIDCCIHDGFVYFPYFKENNEFLYYIFRSSELFSGLGKMGTQLNLNTDTVGDIKIPLPPRNEQEQIVKSLISKIGTIDSIGQKIDTSINLLKEYRSSLITHAVSGQIDITQYGVST